MIDSTSRSSSGDREETSKEQFAVDDHSDLFIRTTRLIRISPYVSSEHPGPTRYEKGVGRNVDIDDQWPM